MVKEIKIRSDYFNPKDTLDCGQIFRYYEIDKGYLVLSGDKACILFTQDNSTVIRCNEEDEIYFTNYFDLQTDYHAIYQRAQNSDYPVLKKASDLGKGIRILRQNSEEMLYSFLISQNNNIPRIKKSIYLICERVGERKCFEGHFYYSFPTSKKMNSMSKEFYNDCGLGYRSEYIKILTECAVNGLIDRLMCLNSVQIKQELLKIKGIGEKVADCVLLFGFHVTESFPVDVWIEKIYKENFNGKLTDRKKITEYFINLFGQDAGYFQQYLFYYKRSLEKKIIK